MKRDDPRHLLAAIARILEQLKIPYAVTGGMAVLVWGRPRFTADIDIVVALDQAHALELRRVLKELRKTGYLNQEDMERAVSARGEFNFIDGETGVKVDFWVLPNNEWSRLQLKRRVARKIAGETVHFISPEDLILIKLQWHKDSGSSRQLEDVESVLKISGDKLDYSYLKAWAKKSGVFEVLDSLVKKRSGRRETRN